MKYLYKQEQIKKNMNRNNIHIQAEFVIAKGKIKECKKLIRSMSKLVKANEPDTLEYKFFLNEDETKCIAHETYRNSRAALEHSNSIASQTVLPKIFKISKINRLDVYGNPSKELRKALTSFNSQIYGSFVGFNR